MKDILMFFAVACYLVALLTAFMFCAGILKPKHFLIICALYMVFVTPLFIFLEH